MKVSEMWLREWVNPAYNTQQLAEKLSMAGLEVDAVHPAAGIFSGVIVAEVINTKPHPQADKLSICVVNNGHEHLQIVCGASNVCAGLKVALAQIHAVLPNGMVIKETTLRGELSQGMLCSATELNLPASSEGIIELDENAPVGKDLRQYLALDDYIFDIDLTPNRADCMSIIGIAREIAALTDSRLLKPAVNLIPAAINEQKNITIQAAEACPRYCGRIIRGINPQAVTPVWLREKLLRSGIKSIHPSVDITNYVMLELGQPMHAYDLAKLQGDVSVRFSQSNESLQLLDGKQVNLQENHLVIADSNKPLALAGVMGGMDSAVNEHTVDIFLESAYFNPITIAGVARQYGIFSEAAQRFERGVDAAIQQQAIERATELVLAVCGGTAGLIIEKAQQKFLPPVRTIAFKPAKVKQLTGMDITEQVMQDILEKLEFSVQITPAVWQVTVPTHRVDIQLDVDLIEEIIRLYGYDKIPGTRMKASLQAGVINPLESLAATLNQFFAARGYYETISYSFVDPELQQALYPEAETLKLLNPISAELSEMRLSLWPGLIASMLYNTHRQQTAIKFFETGVSFAKPNNDVEEYTCVAGLITGKQAALSWNEPTRQYDFYDLKGDLQALFALLKLTDVQFTSAQHSALHPGKSASVTINKQHVGWCGVLHPRITNALDWYEEVILFELNLAALLTKPTIRYEQISKYPQIRRDLSMLVDETITFAQIEEVVKQTIKQDLLKSFSIFDVYLGDAVPVGKKSLAVALILQHDNKTLMDVEINQLIDAIINELKRKFAITLRE